MTTNERTNHINVSILEKIAETDIGSEDFLKNLIKWFVFNGKVLNDDVKESCNECSSSENYKSEEEECSEDNSDEDIYAEWIMKKPFGKLPDQMLYPTVTKRLKEFSNDPDKPSLSLIEEYKQILKDHDDGKITLNPKELECVNRILLDLKSVFEKKTSDNDKDVPKFSGRTIPSLKALEALKANGIDNDFLERYKDNVPLAIELANMYGADSSEMKRLWNMWEENKQEVLISMEQEFVNKSTEELKKEK